jgi:S1-C subfamily serine protease
MKKPGPAKNYAVLVHLAGERRGTTEPLSGDHVAIGGGGNFLRKRGQTYELHAGTGGTVFVNGEAVETLVLASGDVLEVAPGGEVLRFRLYPVDGGPYKSMREAFSDCVDCARYGGKGVLDKAGILLTRVPYQLATQTAPAMRVALLTLLIAALSLGAFGVARSARLERRLSEELRRIDGLEALLARAEGSSYSSRDLEAARAELEEMLGESFARVEALEARAGATERVIAAAADSIVFLQGSYGFVEAGSGRPLRFAVGASGGPLRLPSGDVATTLDGDGPVIEVFYTGTAFVATPEGYLLTNRHVALPWLYDEAALRIVGQGLQPIMQRLIGFLPGLPEPFDVQLVEARDDADVALLRCQAPTSSVHPLRLAATPPGAGDEVIVMGYPTGIRALMARAGERFARELSESGPVDFWQVTRKLAEGGFVAPLATRGIIGQVSAAVIVYDAATMSGGSGGPVLNLDGEVVAVNAAMVPGFTGSNLGVPAGEAAALLARH